MSNSRLRALLEADDGPHDLHNLVEQFGRVNWRELGNQIGGAWGQLQEHLAWRAEDERQTEAFFQRQDAHYRPIIQAEQQRLAAKRPMEPASAESAAAEGQPPAKIAATGSGGTNSAMGAMSIGSSGIIQNVPGPATTYGRTKSFKSCGTFFISDGTTHNMWLNFPWEFPRMFCTGRDLMNMCNEYRYWRTKSIRVRFTMPHQRFSYTTGSGVILSGTDPMAKMLAFCDHSRNMGIPFHPGWSNASWDSFCDGYQTGFSRNTNLPITLPINADLGVSGAGIHLDFPITDFAPGVTQIPCTTEGSYQTTYHHTDNHFRSVMELMINPNQKFNNYLNTDRAYNPWFTGAEGDTGDAITVFRGDNFGCRSISAVASQKPLYASLAPLESYSAPCFHPYTGNNDLTQANNYITPVPVMLDCFDAVGATQNKFYRNFGNEIQVHDPCPQLWLSYVNLLGADGNSIMPQKLMVQFEYEWVVEFSGAYRSYTMPVQGNTIATTSLSPYSLFRKSLMTADPNYIAVPMYNTSLDTLTSTVVSAADVRLNMTTGSLTPQRLRNATVVKQDPTC